jgi:hypothetical protein
MIARSQIPDYDCRWELEDNISGKENKRHNVVPQVHVELQFYVHTSMILVAIHIQSNDAYPAMAATLRLVRSIRDMQYIRPTVTTKRRSMRWIIFLVCSGVNSRRISSELVLVGLRLEPCFVPRSPIYCVPGFSKSVAIIVDEVVPGRYRPSRTGKHGK